MLQKILDAIFGRHTIESAMTHFNRALSKLDAVESREVAAAERHRQEIAEAQYALEEATREAARARNTAAKIRNLVGEGEENTVSLRSVQLT